MVVVIQAATKETEYDDGTGPHEVTGNDLHAHHDRCPKWGMPYHGGGRAIGLNRRLTADEGDVPIAVERINTPLACR